MFTIERLEDGHGESGFNVSENSSRERVAFIIDSGDIRRTVD
jgi:hypothetical protein